MLSHVTTAVATNELNVTSDVQMDGALALHAHLAAGVPGVDAAAADDDLARVEPRIVDNLHITPDIDRHTVDAVTTDPTLVAVSLAVDAHTTSEDVNTVASCAGATDVVAVVTSALYGCPTSAVSEIVCPLTGCRRIPRRALRPRRQFLGPLRCVTIVQCPVGL